MKITHVMSNGMVVDDISGKILPTTGKASVAYRIVQEYYQRKAIQENQVREQPELQEILESEE